MPDLPAQARQALAPDHDVVVPLEHCLQAACPEARVAQVDLVQQAFDPQILFTLRNWFVGVKVRKIRQKIIKIHRNYNLYKFP